MFVVSQAYISDTEDDVLLSENLVEILEKAVDSIYRKENVYSETDYQNFLEQKFDSLLVNEEMIGFFTLTLKCFPKEIFKHGLDYLYKIIYELNACNEHKNQISLIQRNFLKTVEKFFKRWGEAFDQGNFCNKCNK